ncbi:MAG: type II toxin-antitoxin system RelE/ParE family toxin [Bauldia sp.]
MNVIIRAPAYGDLDAIFENIASDSTFAAEKVVERILAAIELLGAFPRIGRPGRISGTRERVVSGLPYVVVYLIDQAAREVQVAAIFHTSRGDPPAGRL